VKSDLSSQAQEVISNIRTVKAFSDEKGSLERFQIGSQKVYVAGEKKARVMALFFFVFTAFQ
jgi:ATP-binding cassette subfamily B multidrug efflux pump